MLEARPYLKSIEILHEDAPKAEYPFNLPLINNLRKIDFHQDITFIVGECGSYFFDENQGMTLDISTGDDYNWIVSPTV